MRPARSSRCRSTPACCEGWRTAAKAFLQGGCLALGGEQPLELGAGRGSPGGLEVMRECFERSAAEAALRAASSVLPEPIASEFCRIARSTSLGWAAALGLGDRLGKLAVALGGGRLDLVEHVGECSGVFGQLSLTGGEPARLVGGRFPRPGLLLEGLPELSFRPGDFLGEITLAGQTIGKLAGFQGADLPGERLEAPGGFAGLPGGVGRPLFFDPRLESPTLLAAWPNRLRASLVTASSCWRAC